GSLAFGTQCPHLFQFRQAETQYLLHEMERSVVELPIGMITKAVRDESDSAVLQIHRRCDVPIPARRAASIHGRRSPNLDLPAEHRAEGCARIVMNGDVVPGIELHPFGDVFGLDITHTPDPDEVEMSRHCPSHAPFENFGAAYLGRSNEVGS